ncbi:MAG: hypothetical protein LWY06_11575 [Firmicutes bacterium]|nr:hypothetical protein [Bacillota bacterium]
MTGNLIRAKNYGNMNFFNNKKQQKAKTGIDVKLANKSFREGLAHYKHNRKFEALTALQKALEYDPDFIAAKKKIAGIFIETGDKITAASYFEEILNTDPKNQDAIEFLYDYYMQAGYLSDAAAVLKKKAFTHKKKEKKREDLFAAADLYFKAENNDEARATYHELLLEEVYNPVIYQKLNEIYHREQNHKKWKVCEEVLSLNKKLPSGKVTKHIKLISAPGPITSEIYEKLTHPGEKTFRKYLSWLSPLIKVMEAPTPPEILRVAEMVPEDSQDYKIYKECCHYLNMDIPPLRHYRGPSRFRFIADPLEGGGGYSLIYNDVFLEQLNDVEKTFLFSNQLSIIKSGFVSLLNLSLGDVAKILMETAAFVFSFLTLVKGLPFEKAAKIIEKTGAMKLFNLVQNFQKKLTSFNILGKKPEELETLARKSAGMLPEKFESGEFDKKSFLKRSMLESVLLGFHHTADRVSYYLTRDLVGSSRAMLYMLAGKDSIERIEKFGLEPYITECRNEALKKRLGELFFFAVDTDPDNA